MASLQSLEKIFLALGVPLSIAALAYAGYYLPVERIDWRFAGLIFITISFSSKLRVKIPRTNVDVTASDAAALLGFLWYGAEAAIIVAFLDAAFSALGQRLADKTVAPHTVVANIVTAVLSFSIATLAISGLYGDAPRILEQAPISDFVAVMALTGISLFLANSILVATLLSSKSGKGFFSTWIEYSANAAFLFACGTALASFIAKTLQEVNAFLFAVVSLFFGILYLSYRRYLNDIHDTSEKAELAVRARAEQAENHVRELEHYVKRLEQSGRDLDQSRAHFRYAAFHDSLTGLPNRNFFLDKVKELMANEDRPEGSFALLYLDLNGFRKINDSLGHTAGDLLIRKASKRLSLIAQNNSIAGRLGGDEFAILLTDEVTRSKVVEFAELVSRAFAKPYELNGRQVFSTVSIGIAFDSLGYDDPEEIFRDADLAMYHAKDHEKKFVVFHASMRAHAVSMMELETDLRRAVEQNEFVLYYQPIVELESLKLRGFEALVRWNHPTLGLISPDKFIPLSETTGLIVPMTVMILEMACRQTARWQSIFGPRAPQFVSVNVSGSHFSNPSLVRQIKEVISGTSLSPKSLKLEITETTIMANGENAVAALARIKDLGVQFSIDDFGTGYSSLGYLQRFPIDTLKIDRVFVRSMEEGQQNGEIVRAVIALSEALGLEVVAEGIESIHQYHQLRVLRCRYGQGYLFSPPVPTHEAEALIIDQDRWQSLLLGRDFLIIDPEFVDEEAMPIN